MISPIKPLFLTALGMGVISYREAVQLSNHCEKQVEAQQPIPLPRWLIPAADRIFLLEQETSATLH